MVRFPTFTPTPVFGRKAMPVNLDGNGGRRKAINIITKDEINERIYSFSDRVLCQILHGADATFAPILNGAINFYANISHFVHEGSHVELMPVQAGSYGLQKTSGKVKVSQDLIIPEKITGRRVIILDDILETGKTVAEVKRLIEPHKPAEIVTVFLLRKEKEEKSIIEPDYWLFDVHPESWVFGFGMDLAEKYRHLRYICDDRLDLYTNDGKPKY